MPVARAELPAATSLDQKDTCLNNRRIEIARNPVTGLLVGSVPGFKGAHSQAEMLDELNANLREVIAMLLEDGEPHLDAEFLSPQNVTVA